MLAIATPVKIVAFRKSLVKCNAVATKVKKVGLNSQVQWSAPTTTDARLGFEMSAYAGADSGLSSWEAPMATDARLGFEMSAYAGADLF